MAGIGKTAGGKSAIDGKKKMASGYVQGLGSSRSVAAGVDGSGKITSPFTKTMDKKMGADVRPPK